MRGKNRLPLLLFFLKGYYIIRGIRGLIIMRLCNCQSKDLITMRVKKKKIKIPLFLSPPLVLLKVSFLRSPCLLVGNGLGFRAQGLGLRAWLRVWVLSLLLQVSLPVACYQWFMFLFFFILHLVPPKPVHHVFLCVCALCLQFSPFLLLRSFFLCIFSFFFPGLFLTLDTLVHNAG